jgi:hypothetical protein
MHPLKVKADLLMRSPALHIDSKDDLRNIQQLLRPKKNAEAAFTQDFNIAAYAISF